MKKKRIFSAGVFSLAILMASCVIYIPYEEQPPSGQETYRPPEAVAAPGRLEISFIYNYLSPYGVWVSLSPYGYVWVPRHVSYRWRPYTYGRWVWTDAGWLWISNFEWGWLPFHYGRWGWHERIGWFWVPGTVWAPAWVIWTWGDLYVGWAPVPPEIDWIPGVGFSVWRLEPPYQAWVFIEGRYFASTYLDRYILPMERNRTVLNFTVNKRSLAPRGTIIVNEGVEPALIERWTRTQVRKYEIRDASRPGREILGTGTVTVPRPTIIKNELSRPRESLHPEEAQERLSRERPALIRLQDLELERRTLERSQKEEEILLRRKMEEERSRTADSRLRQDIERRYQAQLEQLKKQHQEEKAELDKRQEEEKKKISPQQIKKKK